MKGCRPLEPHEIELVLKSFKGRHADRNKCLFMLGLKAGFRIGELLSIRIKDVWLHNKVLDRVEVSKKNVKNKRESQIIIIHPECKPYIEKLAKQHRANGYGRDSFLFRSAKSNFHESERNTALDRKSAWAIFQRVFRQCALGGKLGTHTMRKTFARNIHKALGKDLFKTQKALRHKSVVSTACYLCVEQEEIEEAILSI